MRGPPETQTAVGTTGSRPTVKTQHLEGAKAPYKPSEPADLRFPQDALGRRAKAAWARWHPNQIGGALTRLRTR
jgi:hypothetical protein